MVRAKFVCNEVTQTVDGGKVKLIPVTGTSEENKTFFKYTPFGHLEMGTINPEVMAQFVPGKQYYIDFTEAE